MDELIERLRARAAAGRGDKLLEEAAAALESLRAEVERLTGCLATANANHEQFECQWYLERDRAERLAEALRETREYVTAALQMQREAFAGHEDCSDIPGIEADLHKIDALLPEQEEGNG